MENKQDFTTFYVKLKNGMDLIILFTKAFCNIDIVGFYFKINDLTLEKVEFHFLKDSNRQCTYNRVIRHDYIDIDGDIATTFNSISSYLNNNYISGSNFIRKVNFQDIQKWAGYDNLNNLTVNIDSVNKVPTLYKENNKNVESEPHIEDIASQYDSDSVKVLKANWHLLV